MSNNDWEDPFDNDNDNDVDNYNYLPNEFICEIGFFENEHRNNEEDLDEIMFIMNDHMKYCLGSHVLVTNYNNIPNLFHGSSILIKTFYQFPFANILSYLRWYTYEQPGSFIDIKPPLQMKLHILQTFINPILQNNNENVAFEFESTVIIKTIWLSLVQRHWKKVFKSQKDIILKMKTIAFLQKREININYIPSSRPVLKGMLSCYKKN